MKAEGDTLQLKLPVGGLNAIRLAAGRDVKGWAVKALLKAAGFRENSTGIPGLSDSAPKRLAFRLNWSEGGVKKSTTVSYTAETREQKLAEALALLQLKRGW